MTLIALVIGTSVTVSATERVTVLLVLAGALGWSFVPILQLATGLILIRGAGARTRRLSGYFATHWPWSLWILTAHAAMLLSNFVRTYGLWLAPTAVVPMLWTVRLLLGFCREELRLDNRQCRRRVAMHQVTTYVLVLVCVAFAVALWPRLLWFSL